MDIACIGLGVMGGPMAGHLLAAGHRVRVFNRSPQKALDWQRRHGGECCQSVKEAVEGAAVLVTCVGNDADLSQVCLGEQGAYAWLGPAALHIDHTTTSARQARLLARHAGQRGLGFVDAPVSGGQAGAEHGSLTIMCGGREDDYLRACEVFAAYAKSHGHLGAAGNGQLSKMVNQICVGGVIQALAEALRFGEEAGLDMPAVLAVIEHGAAGSWQMSHRGRSMLQREFDFGFAVDWMRKDLGILLEEAAGLGLDLPLTERVSAYYDEISAGGGGRLDTSALIKRLDRAS